MTLDEANDVLVAWGEYLEHCHDRLAAVFVLGHIPASLLPYPIQTLEDALNVVAEHYFNAGDYESSDFVKSTFGPLAFYCDDNEAITHLFQLLSMPGLDAKSIMLDKLRAYQAIPRP